MSRKQYRVISMLIVVSLRYHSNKRDKETPHRRCLLLCRKRAYSLCLASRQFNHRSSTSRPFAEPGDSHSTSLCDQDYDSNTSIVLASILSRSRKLEIRINRSECGSCKDRRHRAMRFGGYAEDTFTTHPCDNGDVLNGRLIVERSGM